MVAWVNEWVIVWQVRVGTLMRGRMNGLVGGVMGAWVRECLGAWVIIEWVGAWVECTHLECSYSFETCIFRHGFLDIHFQALISKQTHLDLHCVGVT